MVSFGHIGNEIDTLLKANDKLGTNIAKKLKLYGYTTEDIKWLLTHLRVEKVNEDELRKNIELLMTKYIEIATAIDLTYELLIYYIYKLSREAGCTSKLKWEEKVSNIAQNIASIDSLKSNIKNNYSAS